MSARLSTQPLGVSDDSRCVRDWCRWRTGWRTGCTGEALHHGALVHSRNGGMVLKCKHLHCNYSTREALRGRMATVDRSAAPPRLGVPWPWLYKWPLMLNIME